MKPFLPPRPLLLLPLLLFSAATSPVAAKPAVKKSAATKPTATKPAAAKLAEASPAIVSILEQAGNLSEKGQWEDSLKLCDEALKKARELKDKPGIALAWNGKALSYRALKQNDAALDSFRQALVLRRELHDKRRTAVTLSNIGWTLLDLERFEEAAHSLGEAAPLLYNLKDYKNAALTYYGQGRALAALNQTDKAITLYQRSVQVYTQAGESANVAGVLQDIGVLQWHAGQSEAALESFQRSLDLYKKLGNRQAQVVVMSNIGMVYDGSGQMEQAITIYEEALTIARDIKDSDNQAAILNNLGKTYRISGRQQKALQYYNEALALARENGNKVLEAVVLSNIGSVYSGFGQPEKALSFYMDALDRHRANKDRRGEATELSNVAAVLMTLGQDDKAVEYFNQSLQLYRGFYDEREEAITLSNLAGIYRERGEYERAQEMFRQALAIHRKVSDRRGEAITLNSIALTLHQSGKTEAALEPYRQSIAINREIGDLNSESITLTNLALAEQDLQHFDAAAEHLKASLDIVEDLRGELGSLEAAKMSFLENKLHFYHIYIDLELSRGNTEEAFNWLEKTKARSLLDLMQSGPATVMQGVSEADIQRLNILRKQADALNRQLIAAQLSATPDKPRIAQLKKDLQQTENDLQTLRDTLESQHPELAKAHAANTVTLSQVAQFLPADTALLNYAVLQSRDIDKVFLLCTTVENGKAQVMSYQIPLKRAALTKLIDEFRAVNADPAKDYKPQARELYKYLIAPAEKQLAGKKRLAICPDGPLWGLPFQSLMNDDNLAGADKDAPFLWQRYDIAYCYSATVLQTILTERNKKSGRTPAADKTLLALANPDFGGPERFGGARVAETAATREETRAIIATSRALIATSRALIATSREAGAFTPSGAIAPLPGTQNEAEAIRSDFPAAQILTGAQADEAAIKAHGGEYRYLHFATHGLLNDTAPLLSCIVTANPTSDTEDGFLTGREIADLHWNADMVVFSACDTGRGQEREGEGLIGLTWAAFVAGAPTQIVSQWAVNDAATAELMKLFYADLKDGKTKSAALRSSALALLAKPEYAHPYYWAPFILVGDWQ